MSALPARPVPESSSAHAPLSLQQHPSTPKTTQTNSERELASVKVAKEDVDVLAEQVEVDAKAAERRLREHGGDLAAALTSYLPATAATS